MSEGAGDVAAGIGRAGGLTRSEHECGKTETWRVSELPPKIHTGVSRGMLVGGPRAGPAWPLYWASE